MPLRSLELGGALLEATIFSVCLLILTVLGVLPSSEALLPFSLGWSLYYKERSFSLYSQLSVRYLEKGARAFVEKHGKYMLTRLGG